MDKLNQKNEILVLGATGKVGSQVIKFFSEAGIPCTAVTRNLSKSNNLPYINWVQGDLNDKANLIHLFNGARKLFLNTGVTENMVETQINIINAAMFAGMDYIVKLSTPSASASSKDRIAQKHWKVEEYLKKSKINWNILHPQSFMQNWLGYLAECVKTERKIYTAAGDGKKAFIDTKDIGEVAFSLLIHAKDKVNKTIPISGPELVSYYDVANAISKIIGESVTYVPLSPELARERMLKKGIPEWAVQVTLAIELNQKTGAGEKLISTEVQEILGKVARSIYDFANDYKQAFN